jgi:signal transduction histidine kinase
MPLYWTSLCLNNLLDNAFRHGRAPVRLHVGWRKGKLTLRVSDAGQFTAGRSRQAGMGLGLTIVERVMRRLNGRLMRGGPTTTFTLELPSERKK